MVKSMLADSASDECASRFNECVVVSRALDVNTNMVFLSAMDEGFAASVASSTITSIFSTGLADEGLKKAIIHCVEYL